MEIDAIILSESDNVATVLTEIDAGLTIKIRKGDELILFKSAEKIPYGYKITLEKIETGQKIIKYGEVIGQATTRIAPGCVAHVHNIESLRGRGDLD
ncbi:UxaA family hydrolase [bacterium]|nr:UxaA family hydrolase [bacterium]